MNLSGLMILSAAFASGAMTATAEEYYVKELTFPAGADSVTKIDMASRLVPNERQLAWQERINCIPALWNEHFH